MRYPAAAFSILALVIASVGIHRVMNYLVTQHTREFGIRLAIGRYGGRRPLARSALGNCIDRGRLGSWIVGIARLITALLYGVSPSDPATFAAVSLLLSANISAGELHFCTPGDEGRSVHGLAIRITGGPSATLAGWAPAVGSTLF